ncbi:MAG TPA: hypothetical protein PLH91_05030 [Tenuifilaceae bacterium]|nr:hypothetical protein [Tenuifilaceae bacterium]HPI44573.1 hypothetical protein [Tenuifilaceae bacterium]HPN21197.1 hypothetical protein [Tenuifilaceae bacterium]HPV56764.1 hypothetical protein [Tenuifilaceae bacterium]
MNNDANKESKAKAVLGEPTIKTIIVKISKNQWFGCIYVLSSNKTEQVVDFMNYETVDFNEKIIRQPLFVSTMTNKSAIEESLAKRLATIVKSN